MNAGASAAPGDMFWFFHADSRVPSDCLTAIERVLSDPSVAGAIFADSFSSQWKFIE